LRQSLFPRRERKTKKRLTSAGAFRKGRGRGDEPVFSIHTIYPARGRKKIKRGRPRKRIALEKKRHMRDYSYNLPIFSLGRKKGSRHTEASSSPRKRKKKTVSLEKRGGGKHSISLTRRASSNQYTLRSNRMRRTSLLPREPAPTPHLDRNGERGLVSLSLNRRSPVCRGGEERKIFTFRSDSRGIRKGQRMRDRKKPT